MGKINVCIEVGQNISPEAIEENTLHQQMDFRNFCVKSQIMTTLICSFEIQLECIVPGTMMSAGHSVVPKANASLIPTVFN